LPNQELFPVVGLVFAVLIVARRGVGAEVIDQSAVNRGG
jgi:hypothetical protein